MSKAISDRELNRLIKSMSQKPSPAEIRQMLNVVAAPLVDELKLRAPMKIIRRQLGVISKPAKYPLSIMVGLRYDLGTAGNLAYAFEYGTVDRYTKKGHYRGKISPARPWFRPTFDSMKGKIVTNMKIELGKLVTNKINK